MRINRRQFLGMSASAALGGVMAAGLVGKKAFAQAEKEASAVKNAPGDPKYVVEPEKRVAVAREVDVIVSGSGISGLFAALASAKFGAKTVLIDRFGQLGGNIGPGMLVGGSLYGERNISQDARGAGIPKEFCRRVDVVIGDIPKDYSVVSQAVSRVAVGMMKEAGVELVLSAYSADPVLSKNRVRGLFVETKSGRVAFLSKVVIDATGDADVARRAGAPFRRGATPSEGDSPNIWSGYNKPEFKTWNDGGIYFLVAGADINAFRAFERAQVDLSPDDQKWSADNLDYYTGGWTPGTVQLLRKAWESGEFKPIRQVAPNIYVVLSNSWFAVLKPNIIGGRSHVFGDYDAGNWEHISLIEAELRAVTYDAMQFYRKNVPGFKNASLIAMSPFLGHRGGPFIEGEHTLTPQETYAGYRSSDVLFVTYAGVARDMPGGSDMPYGMLLPKKIDGLLVTGRGAAYVRRGHDPGTRARINMMLLGQATGMAAAMAAKSDVTPRELDVKKLQRALLTEGYYLGDDARLAELGLK